MLSLLLLGFFLNTFLGSLSDCDATTNRATTLSTFSAVAELKIPAISIGRLLLHHLNQPTTNPTQPLLTQMQPPVLPLLPHLNFQSVDLYTQVPVTSDTLLTSNSESLTTHSQTSEVTSEVLGITVQYVLTESQSQQTLTSSHAQLEHQIGDELLIENDSQHSNIRAEPFTERSTSQPRSKLPVGEPFNFLRLDSYSNTTQTQHKQPTQSPVTPTMMRHPASVTVSPASQGDLHQTQPPQLPTKGQIYHSFTQSLFQKFHLKLSTTQYHLPSTQTPPLLVTDSQQSQIHSQSSPGLPKPISSISAFPQIQQQASPTQHPLLHSLAPVPQAETFPLQHKNNPKTQFSASTILPPNQTSNPSTMDPEIPVVYQVSMSDQTQVNTSQQGDPVKSAKSANDTELTEWPKRNTSQSPITSNDPR